MSGSARRRMGTVLRRDGIVAIIRTRHTENLERVCTTIIDSGIQCLEVTTNTPGAMEAIHRLRQTYGASVELGAGTVRSVEHVDMAVEAGAEFVVSPDTRADVGTRAQELGLAWYPGALTPTEIASAWGLGATAVKVFPAESIGGARYFQEVLSPLDDVLLIPTGGIKPQNVEGYFRAGAVAVGVGGPLIASAFEDGDHSGLARRVAELIQAVSIARGSVL